MGGGIKHLLSNQVCHLQLLHKVGGIVVTLSICFRYIVFCFISLYFIVFCCIGFVILMTSTVSVEEARARANER